MNVLAFASRKGGAGKSTLAAHLAAHVHKPTRPCLLIDDDPQGSLTLWNELRADSALPLKIVKRGIAHIVKKAKRNGVNWIFIDTPPNNSASVTEAIEAATLVIIPCLTPCRKPSHSRARRALPTPLFLTLHHQNVRRSNCRQ